MDSNQFLSEFGHIANAPGGVRRLRELILALAMQGRLAESKSNDSQISNNLDIINQVKQRLIKEKKVLTSKFVPELQQNEFPHAIPQHWGWVRFGNIAQHNTGKTLNKRQNIGEKRYCITTSNLYWGEFELNEVKQIPIEDKELEKCTATKGDLLICEGGDAGRAAVWSYDYDICFQNHVHRVRFYALVDPYFAFRFLQKISATGEINEFRKGVGISSMSGKALASIPFPLPPLEEQARIVAKVDELMALCDQLGAQQEKQRTLQAKVRKSILQAVALSPSARELQDNWQRLQDNFSQLFSSTDGVEELRQTIFDLAISGRLSNFSESDEPSTILKQKILSAKKLGLEDGTFSRKKQVKPELLEETDLPFHWSVITLDEAISTIDAGWSPACLPNARTDENKWGVLKTTAVQVLKFLPNEHKELPIALDPRPQYQIEGGDILITRAGPRNRVGICCVVAHAPPKLMISDKLIRFHIVNDLINPNFVALCLSAGEPGRILERLKSGMAESQMNISQNKLRSITIPLPPKEEQLRILEKVDSLMEMVNAYSEKHHEYLRIGELTAAATISSLTGIAIEQEEQYMKTPQTELVSTVRLGVLPNVKDQAPLATILTRHNGEMNAKDLWQRFSGDINAFYAQLKLEIQHGWIAEPKEAQMLEKEQD